MKFSDIRKAVVGAAVPGLVVLGAALTPDSPAGGTVTTQEWIAVAIAVLTTGTVVYAVPNAKKAAAKNAAAQEEPAGTM